MNESHTAPPADGMDFVRLLSIVFVFALVGPPIGLVIFVIIATFMSVWNGTQGGLPMIMLGAFYMVPFVYLFGILPAAAAGLLVGASKLLLGRAPWWVALGTGIIVGLGVLYFIEPARSSHLRSVADAGYRITVVTICVLPTMLCWFVVRNWYQAARPDGGAQ